MVIRQLLQSKYKVNSLTYPEYIIVQSGRKLSITLAKRFDKRNVNRKCGSGNRDTQFFMN